MVRNEGCSESWREIPPNLCLISFSRNLIKADCDANKTNQSKRAVFLVAWAVWERWYFGSAAILVHESKEAKLSCLRTRPMPWLMGMGLSYGFVWTLAICLHQPLTTYLLFIQGTRTFPVLSSSFHVLPVMNCKGHGPPRLPLAAHPLGLQRVTASVTSQFLWITS